MITGSTEQTGHFCPMFCTRDIVRYYFRLYILKWRFNINNLVLNVRLYIQMNFLTSVADELIALNASPLNFYISFTEITKFWILCSFNGAWKRHNNPVKLCLLKSSHRVGNNFLYNGRVYLLSRVVVFGNSILIVNFDLIMLQSLT